MNFPNFDSLEHEHMTNTVFFLGVYYVIISWPAGTQSSFGKILLNYKTTDKQVSFHTNDLKIVHSIFLV